LNDAIQKSRAEKKLEITKKDSLHQEHLVLKNGILKISIEPNKRYIEVDLTRCSWIPRDFDRIGGLVLTEGVDNNKEDG
jgi:hypothetical protein